MFPTDDQFRAHVVKLGDGRLMCGFCHQVYAAATSLWRFKWHWSGVEGHGVRPCLRVNTDTKEAASRAHQQPPSKKHKSSSNMIDATSTPNRDQINEVGNLAGDQGSMRLEQGVPGQEGASSDAQASGKHVNNMPRLSQEDMQDFFDGLPVVDMELNTECRPVERTQPSEAKFSSERIIGHALESRADAPLATDRQSIGYNAHLMEVDADGTRELLQPVGGGANSSRRLPCDASPETMEDALPTTSTNLVGEAFSKNNNKIWSWLMNDEVSLIGIYGMGGVGKTSMVKRIYKQLLERSGIFHHVCWIAVSQEFSIIKLQNTIAKLMKLDPSDEEDEVPKAIKLSEQLKRRRWVLILDDLWNWFQLDQVGIPLPMKGCKLILTTRLLEVCQRMVCQRMIRVEPLMWGEAWILFMEKLGKYKALSSEVKKIAESITRECDGLPLGIITMAGAMREVVDIHEWRNALEELKESKIRKDDMEPDVFRILRFSYNHLKDSMLQQCFLYCALFPEDEEIDRGRLIAYLIDEGIIEGMKSRQAEFDKGHTILNKLEKVSLLESCRDHRDVKMHDLIRDMAIQIQQENSQVMVKAGEQLKELPELEEWKESLVRVSLMKNQIEEIPRSHSVRCPKLSTILLLCNVELGFIADSFFNQMPDLKVLDLSSTNIKVLPDSICDLINLNSLLLRDCLRLSYVPSLKKLKRLRRLDLADTVLEEMPQGMKSLSNLRYFSFSTFIGKSEFPIGILPKLSNLRVLVQEGERSRTPAVWVKGQEVGCLKKLETLECYFEHLRDMDDFLKSRGETQTLSSYCFFVGWRDKCDALTRSGCSTSKIVGLANLSISRDGDSQFMFPKDMKELMIRSCNVATSLSNISSSIEDAYELEVVHLRSCTSLESLLASSWFCSARREPLLSQCVFSGLKVFTCRFCGSMKKLFPPILLPNLECLRVEYCKRLEEIIARDVDEDEEGFSTSITEVSLPKLRILELCWLQQLKSICHAKLRCDSLEEICIYGCPLLRRMPFSLPLHHNGHPSPPPISLKKIKVSSMEWWQSAEWEWNHPKVNDVLLPLVSVGETRTEPAVSSSLGKNR